MHARPSSCSLALGIGLGLTACPDDAPRDDGGATMTGTGVTAGASISDGTTVVDTNTTGAGTLDGTADGNDTGPPPDDCNGPAPGGEPGDAEICDGFDQDCDGEIDEGVPNDGAGCLDPGPPADAPEIDEIHVTVHTRDLDFAGTDDPVDVCFPDIGLCAPLNVLDWNDRERGRWDVVVIPGNGATVDQIASMTIGTDVGIDRWEPEGFEVVVDGVPIFCRDDLSVFIGTEAAGELPLWEDPEGFSLHCTTVWPTVLTHGPMVGAVGPDSARIWYRSDATRATHLRVVPQGEDLQAAPVVDYGYPSYLDDHTETVEVFGLLPSTTYDYDLEIEGERFGPWSFTTAPAPGTPAAFRLAFGSCAGDDDQPIWAAVRAWDPDLFLFGGDNHYANSSDLPSLRQWYRWVRERPDRGALLAEASILATWDDHDYVGNNTDGSAPGRTVALEAFGEYWANPSYGTDATPGVFTMHAHADVDLILIDDRYYRGLEGSITGDAQEQWLLDQLSASSATFKLVMSGSQFTLLGTGDSWAVFPEAQTRLRQHIADEGITGVVLLSGDIHRSEFRLLPPAAGGYPIPELTSSPMARGSSGCPAGQAELQACFTGDDYFIGLEIDTTVADPTLTATIFDVGGAALDSWTILRSQLQ